MTIVNTTPHMINVVTGNGIRQFEKSDCQIRVAAKTEEIKEEDGIKLFSERQGDPVIEDPTDVMHNADILIMSRIAASKCRTLSKFDAYRIWIPGDLIRDEVGVVVGCKGFIEV